MASNTTKVFNTFAQSRLTAAITNLAVTCEIIDDPAHLFPNWVTGSEFYMTLVDASANREIVKVTAISGSQLTITRGQGGSTARAWPIGTLIEQRPTKDDLSAFIQEAVFRTVAYNPNGVVSATYPGEKVYETGTSACRKRWWKNISGTIWQLIAGEDCESFIYIFGGTNGGVEINDTDEFTVVLPGAGTWASKTNGRTRTRGAATSLDNKMYVVGGYDAAALDNCDEYDPDTWTAKTGIPVKRYEYAAAIGESGKGYYFAGRLTGGALCKTNHEYDPDTWTGKTDLPDPARYACAGFSLSDKPYCIGGHGAAILKDNDQFDPTGNAWAAKTDIPEPPRETHTCAALRGKGYIAYGYEYIAPSTVDGYECDEYDPTGDAWVGKTEGPLPKRHDLTGGAAVDYFHVAGGYSGGRLKDTETYNPVTDAWATETDMPDPARSGSCSAGLR